MKTFDIFRSEEFDNDYALQLNGETKGVLCAKVAAKFLRTTVDKLPPRACLDVETVPTKGFIHIRQTDEKFHFRGSIFGSYETAREIVRSLGGEIWLTLRPAV